MCTSHSDLSHCDTACLINFSNVRPVDIQSKVKMVNLIPAVLFCLCIRFINSLCIPCFPVIQISMK